jgi:type VI secretion system secreted protein Hcp
MAINAFLRLEGVTGESAQKGHEGWIEVQGWDWEIEAESSWTKGGGASVGKPRPAALSWTHQFDLASIALLGKIAGGRAFPTAELQVARTTGRGTPKTYLTATMQDVYITKVTSSGTEEGQVLQQISMVFKHIAIEYRPQDSKTGGLGAAAKFTWDIPAGMTSPSS